MEIGQKVALYDHGVFLRLVTIDRIGTVWGSEPKRIFCYKTNEGLSFYFEPDPETGYRFNVGNKAFWISEPI